MLKLMRLELKKFKLSHLIRGFLIASLSVFALIVIASFTPDGLLETDEMVFEMISAFTRLVFTIYGSSLLARMVIGEYKNQTIGVLFTYPVSRKKIMAAKLAIITLFTYLSIVLSIILIMGLYAILNMMHPVSPPSFLSYAINHMDAILINALPASLVALIPLFFGMRKKSITATIISSVIIVSLLSSTNGGSAALWSNQLISFGLGALGLLVAWLSIINIDKVDVIT